MRISVTIFVILISTCIVNASVLDPVIENVVHLKASKPPAGVAGIWKKKTIWKPRWVKEWKSAKVMKPVWKKVWSPVQIREWVPIPKPPPGWDSISTPLSLLHPKRQKAPVTDSAGYDSFTVHTANKSPLWDPVPYPESQQPPPPPPPLSRPLHNADSSCGKGDCEYSQSATTFNHQQISEIIGPRQNAPENVQNEYSETVNHLMRLPPDGSSWKPLPEEFQTDNRYNKFPGLPEFLVPPTFPPGSSIPPQLNHFKSPVSSGPPMETLNNLRQFPPASTTVKHKGHLTTKQPEELYKFDLPEPQGSRDLYSDNKQHSPTHSNSSGFHPLANSDYIQEAQLVEEYHYSEFDLPDIKPPQQDKSEHVTPQQRVQPELQKPIKNHQPKQNRTETVHPQSQHVQKKHIFPSQSLNPQNNIQQQKAILKEIFPIFNNLSIKNTQSHKSLPSNDKELRYSTALLPVGLKSNNNSTNDSNQLKDTVKIESIIPSVNRFSRPSASDVDSNNQQPPPSFDHNPRDGIQQQKKNYPVYEIPQIPHNHRFSAPSLTDLQPFTTNDSNRRQKENNSPHKISTLREFLLPIPNGGSASTTNTGTRPQLHNYRLHPPSLPDFKFLSTNKTNQEQRENYPVYEKTHNDFPSTAGTNQNTTKLQPVPSGRITKPFERDSDVQLVFPTTPDEPFPELLNQNLQKTTTTTEPYAVIFSSSLLSTTEAATLRPVIIVTPANQNDPNQV